PSQAPSRSGHGLLMSIAVSPAAQGTGIGRKLVRCFLEEAQERGLQYVDLTTDRMNNDIVNRFYQGLGFVCVRSYTTPESREMNEYEIQLVSLPRSRSATKP